MMQNGCIKLCLSTELDYADSKTVKTDGCHLIRCRTVKAMTLCIIVTVEHGCSCQLPASLHSEQRQNSVIGLFRSFCEVIGKCDTFSSVEQVNLCRMVCSSILIKQKVSGKNFKYQYGSTPFLMKNGITEQYCSRIISTIDRFYRKWYIDFDAELNGLQSGCIGFLKVVELENDLVKYQQKEGIGIMS